MPRTQSSESIDHKFSRHDWPSSGQSAVVRRNAYHHQGKEIYAELDEARREILGKGLPQDKQQRLRDGDCPH